MPHSTSIEPQGAAAPQLPSDAAQDAAQDSALAHFNNLTEIAILKIFIDYKVFELIPEKGDIEISDLAKKVGGEKSLLERLSRFLVVTGVLTSPAPGRVAHTLISLGYRGYGAPSMTLVHIFNFLQLSATYWPEYFEKNGLREPERSNVIPFGLAAGYPDRNLYSILETMPKKAFLFNLTMANIVRLVNLKGIYDFTWVKDFISTDQERPLIVDVGGGKGQGLKTIFKDFPYIPASRCVLVDRPDVIEENSREIDKELRSVKQVEGDMFQEQPVKGALIYHISRVLNDWPDAEVVEVLKHMRAACAPDSRILIVEEMLLNKPSSLNVAQDLFLMNFGGKRRNGHMFQELAAKAGLRVNGAFTGENSEGHSDVGVVELVPV